MPFHGVPVARQSFSPRLLSALLMAGLALPAPTGAIATDHGPASAADVGSTQVATTLHVTDGATRADKPKDEPGAAALSVRSADDASTTVNVPSSIDATGASDVSTALQGFVNDVPDGSTVVFGENGVYRTDNGLRLDNRHDLTLEGNGATLKASGCEGTDSPIVIGWTRPSSDIVIRDFTLLGDNAAGGTRAAYHAACQSQIGVLIHQSTGVEVSHVTISHVYGDCLNVSDNMTTLLWSEDVWFHDSTCSQNGRQGVQVGAGRHVTINNVTFQSIAKHVLDIEPKHASGGGVDITFRNNTVSRFGLSSTRNDRAWFIGINGQVKGADISDVTVDGNLVKQGAISVRIATPGVRNVAFHDNRSTKKVAGPTMIFQAVTGVSVSGNTQPRRSGPLARFIKCKGVDYKP